MIQNALLYDLSKREMFSDQILKLKWVAKRLKHVWSNTGLTPQAKKYGLQITQRTSLKKSIAAIILLEILEEGGDYSSAVKNSNLYFK